MIPELIPNPSVLGDGQELTDAICQLAGRWGVNPTLVARISMAQDELPFELHLFSGARTAQDQARVSSTPFYLSTHADQDERGCYRLATGVDVQPISPGIRLSNAAVAQMGAAFTRQGLRWGGGAPVDEMGIPAGNERWHVDMGPRSQT